MNMTNITLVFVFCCFYVCTGTDPKQFLRKPIPNDVEETIVEKLILPMKLLSELDNDWTFDTDSKLTNLNRKNSILEEMITKYTKNSVQYQNILSSNAFKMFYKNCVVNQDVKIDTGKSVDQLKKMSSKAKAEQLKELWPENEEIYKEMSKAEKSKALWPKGKGRYKNDFTLPLDKKLSLPKLALMQSFLVRQELNEIETRKSKLYRLSSADIANLYQEGQVHCIDRLMSTSKPKNTRTFLIPEERKDNFIPANLQEMEIVIKKPAGTPCGVYIPYSKPRSDFVSNRPNYQSGYEKDQREVLIPAGTCFKVTKKETSTGTATNRNLRFKIEMTCLDKRRLRETLIQ